jgi:zinc-binding in reverse transcriptase
MFSTHSCYLWLEFRGISTNPYRSTWDAFIPLKIKIFLWLVQKNKLLTKKKSHNKGMERGRKMYLL